MDRDQFFEQHVEAELLERIARQDGEAFACFYDRTSGTLFSIAKSIVRDAEMAEDVLQEVYSTIWEKAATYNPALGKPISWAIALTRNRALDKIRSIKRREAGVRRLEESYFEQSDTESAGAFDRQEVASLMRNALVKLDPKKRQAVELAFLHGLPHAEVAEALEEPLGTVKAWIRRGLIELRDELADILEI
jgi:RNA polymerase sigma-70 factor (ECF subfamily)